MTAPVWSDAQVLNQLISGSAWGASAITYAFPTLKSHYTVTMAGNELDGFVPFNAQQQSMATLAMATWADLIVPRITQVAPGNAHINFGYTSTGIEFAHAYFPENGSAWFNSTQTDLANPRPGTYGFSTFVHEIGHALGLNHMGDYDGEGDFEPSSYQDSIVYSIMSYMGPESGEGEGRVAWGNWYFNGESVVRSAQTPMINDIMAVQQIYGAANTRPENSVYGFGSSIQGATQWLYDFSLNVAPILAFYDAGGYDTLDLSGWNTDSHINLTPGSLSSANGMTHNLSIARNTVIEAVVTGAGDDVLRGNGADNFFRAGDGKNTIDGDAGRDTAEYEGARGQYEVVPGVGGFLIRNTQNIGNEDTVSQVEKLVFSDVSVNLNMKSARDAISTSDLNSLLEMYVAFFNRIPEADGVEYWVSRLKEGMSWNAVADAFYAAGAQYSRLTGFSTSMSSSDFVNVVYRNVLGRKDGADAEGLNHWIRELDSGTASRGTLVMQILGSAHTFKGNETWGWVADLLDNKISVANFFAVDQGLSYLDGDTNVSKGMQIAAAITPTDTAAAIQLIGVNDSPFA